jgi:hypothetical protein
MNKGQESEGARGAAVLIFVLQQVVSTVGALLLGSVAALILATLIAFFTRTPVDLFKIGADNPYFACPILMAFILGWVARRSEIRGAAWMWVLPTFALVWNVVTWKSYSPLPRWEDVRENFFTSNCGDSACIYELLITAPFYTSVAYSLGWVVRNLGRMKVKLKSSSM